MIVMVVARGGAPAVDFGPLILGIILVVGFMVARVWYVRRRNREPPLPSGHQPRDRAWQTWEERGGPTPKDHGPGHQDGPEPREYENATRDPEVMAAGDRLLPGEIRHYPGPRTYPVETLLSRPSGRMTAGPVSTKESARRRETERPDQPDSGRGPPNDPQRHS